MSGHSKWSTIKRKKGALDAKRGKIFTKIIREISGSVRDGGPDPDGNPRLRLAIQNAKGANMPKDNIDRAIKKGSGADADTYLETSYEGYATHGIAVFVDCMTDNINRTVQNVRATFNKYGGALGTNGSLQFIFTRKGYFSILIPENFNGDEFTLEIIDAGAEDVVLEDDYIIVSCTIEYFGKLQKKLEEMNMLAEVAELQRIPNTLIKLDNEAFKKAMKLIDHLEDDDDVQKVYHNIDITEEQMELEY